MALLQCTIRSSSFLSLNSSNELIIKFSDQQEGEGVVMKFSGQKRGPLSVEGGGQRKSDHIETGSKVKNLAILGRGSTNEVDFYRCL